MILGVQPWHVAALGVASFLIAATGFAPFTPKPGDWERAQETTLREVFDGAFPTGLNKEGLGGVTVLVRRVVFTEFWINRGDGDWHITAQDPTLADFVVEVVPRDQQFLGRPPLNEPLAILGVPYCDHGHEDQEWHLNRCWEIHPLLGWREEDAGTDLGR